MQGYLKECEERKGAKVVEGSQKVWEILCQISIYNNGMSILMIMLVNTQNLGFCEHDHEKQHVSWAYLWKIASSLDFTSMLKKFELNLQSWS